MEMIKEEDIKIEPSSMDPYAKVVAEGFGPLGKLNCIKIEKTSMEPSAERNAENPSKNAPKRRKYSAIGEAFNKVLDSLKMEDADMLQVTPQPLPTALLPTNCDNAVIAPDKHLQYRCELCQKSFSVRASLITHLRVCTRGCMDTRLPLGCQNCGVEFLHEIHLKNHFCRFNGVKPLKCSTCEKPFDTRLGLRCSCAMKPNQHSLAQKHLKKTMKRPVCPHKKDPENWKCESLAINFDDETKLNRHLRIHWGAAQECAFCGAILPLLTDLSKHLERHVICDNVYQCKICPKFYISQSSLSRHQYNSHRDAVLQRSTTSTPVEIVNGNENSMQEFVCQGSEEICTENLKANAKFIKRLSFLRIKPHKCGICQRRFATKYALRRHGFVEWICSLSHFRSKLHKCYSCRKGFRRLRAFREHMRVHKTNRRMQYACKHSDALLIDKLNRETHLKNQHPSFVEEDTQHIKDCANCLPTMYEKNLQSDVASGVKEHFQQYTKNQTLFHTSVPPSNPRSNSTKLLSSSQEASSSLLTHLESLEITIKSEPKADICGEDLEQAFELEVIRGNAEDSTFVAHSDTTRYICRLCYETFPGKLTLNSHMLRHVNRSYSCEQCGAIFALPTELRAHIGSLHSEASYKCRSCLKWFASISSLQAHDRGKKRSCLRGLFLSSPYHCLSCRKGFRRLATVREHQKLHLKDPKELPHACNYCNAFFIYRYQSKQHFKQHLRYVSRTSTGYDDMAQELDVSNKAAEAGTVIFPKINDLKLKKGLMDQKAQKSDSMEHVCKMCLKPMRSLSNLYWHMKKHRKRSHACKKCGAIFALAIDLKNHTENFHSRKKTRCSRAFLSKKFLCYSCKRGFEKSWAFRHHQRLHLKDPKELPYACNYCNAFFIYRQQIENHLRKHTPLSLSSSEVSKIVVKTEPKALKVTHNNDNAEHEFEVIVLEEDQDSASSALHKTEIELSSSCNVVDSEGSYTIAINNVEWMVQVETAQNVETEKASNIDINLSRVKIERTESFENLLNPEGILIKAERL